MEGTNMISETAATGLKSYHVAFDSMEPAIMAGSDVIGDRSYYARHQPKRWDVVVFSAAPPDGSQSSDSGGHFVKRIVGLPNETIHLSPKGLRINGAMMAVPAALKDRFSCFECHSEYKFGVEAFTIPDDSVFVIGDNRDVYVSDSRELGAVPIRNLEARVVATVQITPVT